jgi:hypothetical protein
MEILYLSLVGLGVMIALFALFKKSREREPIAWRDRVTGGRELPDDIPGGEVAMPDTMLQKMEEHLNEIDKTLDDFHSTANAAISELDEKYQELLFLYSLIDEKKKEVMDIYSSEPKITNKPAAKPKPSAEKNRASHPRRKDIINLSKQGLNVSEIAQELNVGQDMVSLILEMGKAR